MPFILILIGNYPYFHTGKLNSNSSASRYSATMSFSSYKLIAIMPTPFTHLRTAQRLLDDKDISPALRELLYAQHSAFLLGNVAADARVDSGLLRANTHFYQYDQPITQHPWRVMLDQNPSLSAPTNDAQRAFVAGYVAHLSMDETWSLEMLRPHFVEREWGTQQSRFFMLHILLIHMDERDYATLNETQRSLLQAAQPESWTPFMNDDTLKRWGDFIAEQLPPGESHTLQVFGQRIRKTVKDFRTVLDSAEEMQTGLWANIAPEILEQVEAQMYIFAREQMVTYLNETGVNRV